MLPCFACKANRDSKSRSEATLNSFQCHKLNGGLRFGERASVRNYIFQGKPTCLDLYEMTITWYTRLCFGNRACPWTRVDE